MKIKFFWSESFGEPTPACKTDVLSEDGVDILGCLLMDDGGLPAEDTFKWIHEGLKSVDAVISGSIDCQYWDREVWGAAIRSDKVEVYSLLEESCSALLDIHAFNTALKEWLDFMVSEDRAARLEISTG